MKKKKKKVLMQCPCGNPLCHEKIPQLCGFGHHAYPEVFEDLPIPTLPPRDEYYGEHRRMISSSDPQAYYLWPVWTIEWIRVMQQKKGEKIQVIGRINWGHMKNIDRENLEDWV